MNLVVKAWVLIRLLVALGVSVMWALGGGGVSALTRLLCAPGVVPRHGDSDRGCRTRWPAQWPGPQPSPGRWCAALHSSYCAHTCGHAREQGMLLNGERAVVLGLWPL